MYTLKPRQFAGLYSPTQATLPLVTPRKKGPSRGTKLIRFFGGVKVWPGPLRPCWLLVLKMCSNAPGGVNTSDFSESTGKRDDLLLWRKNGQGQHKGTC